MVTIGMNYRVLPGKESSFEEKFRDVLAAFEDRVRALEIRGIDDAECLGRRRLDPAGVEQGRDIRRLAQMRALFQYAEAVVPVRGTSTTSGWPGAWCCRRCC